MGGRVKVLPVVERFVDDCETPVSAFLKLRGSGPAFLLESAEQGQRVGRWSFIGYRPHSILRWSLADGGDPYALAAEAAARHRQAPIAGLPPFAGGAVGLFGFDCVRQLEGLPPEILLVPLIGHSRGHSGVAIDTGQGWLLHAGDAYFYHGEIDPDRRRCPPMLDVFQRVMEIDSRARMKKRSVRIRGHATSVSLEEPFWDELKRMAAEAGLPLAGLVEAIDGRRRTANLSSALRLAVLYDHEIAPLKFAHSL